MRGGPLFSEIGEFRPDFLKIPPFPYPGGIGKIYLLQIP